MTGWKLAGVEENSALNKNSNWKY